MRADLIKAVADAVEAFKGEFFMIESPSNHYLPSPPEGFFGMRSGKRRIFVPLEQGRIPQGEALKRAMANPSASFPLKS